MWFYAFTLCMSIGGDPCRFPVPVHSQSIFATDRECVVALIRVAHFYELEGMTIRNDRCNPVHWDVTLDKPWR